MRREWIEIDSYDDVSDGETIVSLHAEGVD